MQTKVNPTSHVMMSETLRGQVPELEGEVDAAARIDSQAIKVIIDFKCESNDKKFSVLGILRGIVVSGKPELDVRCFIEDALRVLALAKSDLIVRSVGLTHGIRGMSPDHTRDINVRGPLQTIGVRLEEIDAVEGMCTLGLHLDGLPSIKDVNDAK